MDLSNYKIDDATTGGGSKVEPGRYVLHWAGEEAELVEGRNNWRGCKMYFEVDGAGITLNHTFTVGHDNPKFVDSGVNSISCELPDSTSVKRQCIFPDSSYE